MRCPECGHAIDLINESQPVCPACGADPFSISGDSGPVLDGYLDMDANEPETSFEDLIEQADMKR